MSALKMQPHTAAKHVLLRRYLAAWFPIVGRYEAKINYIDGFAGPGQYDNGEDGSPMIALEAARSHYERGTLAHNVIVNFVFVEAESQLAADLEQRVRQSKYPQQFRIKVKNGAFADEIGGILDELEEKGRSLVPTFAFVDPFGFSGIPLTLMGRILRYRKCEVFINVMIDFINRFLEHPNDKIAAHFPEMFGSNDVLLIPRQSGDRVGALLGLYRRQLRQYARYVGRFDMHGRRDQKRYSLFFASNSPRGFEKMKEAMWSVDRSQGSKFSDAHPAGLGGFDLFGYQPLWQELLAKFAGQRVLMADVDRFVIEGTDYLLKHARELLREHEEGKCDVQVDAVAGYRRRKGTFKADKVFVRFPAG